MATAAVYKAPKWMENKKFDKPKKKDSKKKKESGVFEQMLAVLVIAIIGLIILN